MRKLALVLIVIGLTACGAATPSTPRPGDTPVGAAYASGGLGLSQQEWEKAHKQSEADSPYTKYDGDKYWIIFMDGKVWSLDRDYDEDEPVLDKARQEGKSLIPKDAELIESFSPDGFPELTVDLYLSESLKTRFDSDVWHDDEPGTFMVIYGVYDKKVGNFTIGTGNDYNDAPSANMTPGPPVAVITTDALNVRDGPGVDYARIGEVKKGDRLDIIAKDRTEGWFLVCCVGEKQGWISGNYVRVEGSLTGIPAEEPVATPLPTKQSDRSRVITVVLDTPTTSGNCDPSYPDVCIKPFPPDLDCGEIPYRNFRVLPPDPHKLDGNDHDGIGCETQ